MSDILKAIFLVAVLSALSSRNCVAFEPDRSIRQLQHTSWTIGDGAPPDIWALAQAPDGFLWIASGAGLYRFDGVTFDHFQPPRGEQFPSIDMTSVATTPSGDIWVGYDSDGVTRVRAGQITNFGLREGLPRGRVYSIAVEPDGVVWAAAARGLARYDGKSWQTIAETWNYPALRADYILLARNGTLWVTTGETIVYLKRDSKRFERTGVQAGEYAVMAEAPDGSIWISDDVEGTRRLDTHQSGALPRPSVKAAVRPEPVRSKALLFDSNGVLWGTDGDLGGIYRLPFSRRYSDAAALRQADVTDRFGLKDGLTADIAVPLIQDTEGDIWVGTNLGLNRFRHKDFALLSGIPETSQSGYLLAANRSVYVVVGDSSSLFRVVTDAPPTFLSRTPPKIRCLYASQKGDVWIGSAGGVSRFGTRGLGEMPLPGSDSRPNVMSIAEDNKGSLWAALAYQGIFRLKDGRWTRQAKTSDLPNPTPTLIVNDPDGRLWFGFFGNVAAVLNQNRIKVLTSRVGLNVGNVMTIYAEGRDVWIGGELGLATYDGKRAETIGSNRVAPFSGITGIVSSEDGAVWINGILGIVRVTPQELRHAILDPTHHVQYQLFDSHDGVSGAAQQSSGGSTAVRGPDGRLWFATNHGVISVDPTHLAQNGRPPPVSILALTADGTTYPLAGAALPSGIENLRVDYSAPSLSIPERVRFRYRLEGFDARWIDAGARRQAFYAHLGPGSYRFRVIAANSDGLWNLAGASLGFTIPPTFLQTRLFTLLCVSAATGMLWVLYVLRLRRVASRVRDRLEERLKERERIARELHDTMLQGFQGLVLRFQAIVHKMPSGDPTRGQMEQALARADSMLIDGRERVRGLRATEHVNNFPQSLTDMGEELADGHPAKFRVIVEGAQRDLHAIVQEELIRIGHEALFNAFHHAGASRIEVELVYNWRELRVRFRDDGCGIPADVLAEGGRPGHFGLTGIRERVSRIQANFTLWSRSGAGTELAITVPANVAYVGGRIGMRALSLRRLLMTESET